MSVKKALVFDLVVLVVYVLAANPAITGLPVHEWAGLGVFAMVFAHTAARFGRFARPASGGAVGIARAVLDVLLVLALMACVISGLMVSVTVLSALGLYATGYYFWDPLHALSAKALLALLLIHIALNWNVIAAMAKRRDSEDDE